MGTTETRLANKVNLENVYFEKIVKCREDKPIVTFAFTGGTLFFNPLIVERLGMADWGQVIVGYDRATKILILKKCEVEEYGAVKVKETPTNKNKNTQYQERAKKCRVISIGHLVRSLKINCGKQYKVERSKDILYLESLNSEKQCVKNG